VAPAVPEALPVLVGGELPQVAAGEVVVFEDGQPISVSVFVDNDSELVVQASTFELRLAGECTNGCTIETSDDGFEVLTLEEDGRASVNGLGFQAGSPVDVWLFSEPRYLGRFIVNADGTFSGSVALGDINPGEHTLQVNGVSVAGATRSANLGVVVNPVPGVLPSAGLAENFATLWMMVILLGLGFGSTLIARRSRRIN
jgi:hypothetical protein